ncbi:hypothetical protein [Eisenibacter elegans]|jgi:hypothetical protein|uniref:hypothetical protein n=1 Tax=Eisenibacter elegans TaxID=997 RepID=UPI00041AB3AC|nr:hypothetical protein [Eisenibacter elegans]
MKKRKPIPQSTWQKNPEKLQQHLDRLIGQAFNAINEMDSILEKQVTQEKPKPDKPE